ncbi:MAG TPA: pyrroloquinoline quinone precursor peptide PqqA [Xanthobacteraceae bacterium]|jgi:coenzyme PQQ precursor peptide PqqA
MRGGIGGSRYPERPVIGKNQERRKNVCKRNATMAWTTPTLVEICIGLEINGYLPAEI